MHKNIAWESERKEGSNTMKEVSEGHQDQKFFLTQIIGKIQSVGQISYVLDMCTKLNSHLP